MKIVIDSSSMMNLYKYYLSNNTLHNELYNFFISKIKCGEIIIIQKVKNELKDKIYNEFKKDICSFFVDTDYLQVEIEKIRDNNIAYQNQQDFIKSNGTGSDIVELDEYWIRYADIHLIAYCEYLRSNGEKDIYLITDENGSSKDKKIIEKIPVICRKMNINCENIAYLLFEIYENELDFNLHLKP